MCCHPLTQGNWDSGKRGEHSAAFIKGSTWKKNATMSQSAEYGAAVVPEWYASHPKHCTVSCCFVHALLRVVRDWRRATRWSFLRQKTIHGKYITCKLYWLIFTNYNLKDFKIVECLNPWMNGSKPIDSHWSRSKLFGAHLPPPTTG